LFKGDFDPLFFIDIYVIKIYCMAGGLNNMPIDERRFFILQQFFYAEERALEDLYKSYPSLFATNKKSVDGLKESISSKDRVKLIEFKYQACIVLKNNKDLLKIVNGIIFGDFFEKNPDNDDNYFIPYFSKTIYKIVYPVLRDWAYDEMLK